MEGEMRCSHCGGTYIREPGYSQYSPEIVCINCGRWPRREEVPLWLQERKNDISPTRRYGPRLAGAKQ
jgi:recombinational DNA repair protein (RecF pathway)